MQIQMWNHYVRPFICPNGLKVQLLLNGWLDIDETFYSCSIRPEDVHFKRYHWVTLTDIIHSALTVLVILVITLLDPEKQDNWSQKSWEDLLLKMLSKSLDVVDHEEWIAELGEAFGNHIPMYSKYPDDKVGGAKPIHISSIQFLNWLLVTN